jgi:hypothetical protein
VMDEVKENREDGADIDDEEDCNMDEDDEDDVL